MHSTPAPCVSSPARAAWTQGHTEASRSDRRARSFAEHRVSVQRSTRDGRGNRLRSAYRRLAETRDWFEGFVKPFAELETPFFDFGHTYALVSVVGALTRGNGDATSSLAPQGARSTTSDVPQHAALED